MGKSVSDFFRTRPSVRDLDRVLAQPAEEAIGEPIPG